MIDAIKSFFELIVNAVSNGWNFLISVFEDIAYVVTSLGTFVIRVRRYLSFLPPAVYLVFGVGISGAIIYKIIGRD